MIAQVRDIINLSAEWNLTFDERINLYNECAKALDTQGDSQGAFEIYYKYLQLVNMKDASKYQGESTALVINAVKGPKVINFEEILVLEVVSELKKSAKNLFEFVDLFVK